MSFRIRRAQRCDWRVLVEIERASLDPGRYKWVLSPRAFRHHIDNAKACLLVCSVSEAGPTGAVAGYALALSRANSKILRFASLAVLPKFRRRGVGAGLLHAIEAHAHKTNCSAIVLEIRQDDRILFRRYCGLGYRPQKTIKSYHPDGGNALRLVKALAVVLDQAQGPVSTNIQARRYRNTAAISAR